MVNLATASRKEDNCANLTVTYVHDPGKVAGTILARIEGSDPASGTYRYYCQDIIGSTRSVWNQDKTEYASYEYTPYGEVYAHSGADVKHRFTGQEWDDAAELYYFPYRYYSPEIARWITRDPSGMDAPNLYTYARGNPSTDADPLGLWPFRRWDKEKCQRKWDEIKGRLKELQDDVSRFCGKAGHAGEILDRQIGLRREWRLWLKHCKDRWPPDKFAPEAEFADVKAQVFGEDALGWSWSRSSDLSWRDVLEALARQGTPTLLIPYFQ